MKWRQERWSTTGSWKPPSTAVGATFSRPGVTSRCATRHPRGPRSQTRRRSITAPCARTHRRPLTRGRTSGTLRGPSVLGDIGSELGFVNPCGPKTPGPPPKPQTSFLPNVPDIPSSVLPGPPPVCRPSGRLTAATESRPDGALDGQVFFPPTHPRHERDPRGSETRGPQGPLLGPPLPVGNSCRGRVDSTGLDPSPRKLRTPDVPLPRRDLGRCTGEPTTRFVGPDCTPDRPVCRNEG